MTHLLGLSARRWSFLATSSVLAASLLAAPVSAAGAAVTIDPSGPLPSGTQTVTVSGTGFDPVGNDASGIYVAFGPVTAAPNYYMDPSVYAVVKWVYPAGTETAQTAAMATDGSFSTKLDIPSSFTAPTGPVDCAVVACAVITFGAHGSPDRSQDTCTAVTFVPGAASGSAGPEASVAPVAPAASMMAPSGSAMPAASGGTADPCASITAAAAP